jgi:hypothetical protein
MHRVITPNLTELRKSRARLRNGAVLRFGFTSALIESSTALMIKDYRSRNPMSSPKNISESCIYYLVRFVPE